jgi:PilZ domain
MPAPPNAPAEAAPAPERRAAPRIPVGIPVCVISGGFSCAGRVRDASLTGLLVELSEPLAFVEADVVVALVLPNAGRHDVDAEIVRRALDREGNVLLALRLGSRRPRPLGAPRGPRAAARAAPPAGWQERERPRAVALAELRAVGTRAYELALVDADATAPAPLVAWLGRLATELGEEVPRRPTACRDLLTAVSDLSRRARLGQSPAQPR